MTILRGGVVLGAMSMQPRWAIAPTGVQITASVPWAKRPITIKNPPYTIVHPHRGQIDARINFAETARAGAPYSGFTDGLPGAAAYVRDNVTGFKSSLSLSPDEYPSRKHRTWHTYDDLKRMELEYAYGGRAVRATR